MGKLAQVAMAAGLAALGCSSSTVNDSGATGGAGSGGAAGASGASSGGAGGSSTGGGSAGQDAATGGASGKVWCAEKMDCTGLCGSLAPWCSSGIICTCGAATCQPGSAGGCPPGMQCDKGGDGCQPIGTVPLGQPCSYWASICELGALCATPNTGPDTCRKPCDPKSPPAGCQCEPEGWCK